MTSRRAYPSDLSDVRWSRVEPTLTAWRTARTEAGVGGQPPEHDLRDLFDAILYLNRTGIPWRYLPHDYPPYHTVYNHFAAWTREGIFERLNIELTGLARKAAGREQEPTGCIIDTQSVKTSTNVPLTDQGIDPGKKIVGRKRGIVVDTLGLLLAVIVTAASVSDNQLGIRLFDQAKPPTPPSAPPGPTPASTPAPSNTSHTWASTSRSCPATPRSKASRSSRNAGSSNAASTGS